MEDEVQVGVDTSDLKRAIHRYEDRTRNLPMDLVGQMLVNASDEMFETEGGAGTDGPWTPLAESTLQRHPRRRGGQILQDTGATANVQIDEISEFSVTITSPTGWSGFHTDGTRYMPKRDFFAFDFGKVLDAVGDEVLQEFG